MSSYANCECGFPVVAPSDGVVRLHPDHNLGPMSDCASAFPPSGGNNGWGISLYFRSDDGWHAMINHFKQIFIHDGEYVKGGQVIGLAGASGHTQGSCAAGRFPHVHVQLFEQIPDPRDWTSVWTGPAGTSENVFFQEVNRNDDTWYSKTSLNDLTFDRRRYEPLHGRLIEDDFGQPYTRNGILDVEWYYPYDRDRNYGPFDVSLNAYVVRFTGTSQWNGVMVYDALGGARQAYVVGWNEWRVWQDLRSYDCREVYYGGGEPISGEGGPTSCLYNPIGNSYWMQEWSAYAQRHLGGIPVLGAWRQDFQGGYLETIQFMDGHWETHLDGWAHCPPGLLDRDEQRSADDSTWDPRISYLFADAYSHWGGYYQLGEALPWSGADPSMDLTSRVTQVEEQRLTMYLQYFGGAFEVQFVR